MVPGKHKLCCLGNFTAELCVDEKVIKELICAVKDLKRPLLGRSAAEEKKVPLPLYQKAKDKLDGMLEPGVIWPVDQPTDWCAPMVATPTRKRQSESVCRIKQAGESPSTSSRRNVRKVGRPHSLEPNLTQTQDSGRSNWTVNLILN